MKKTILTCSIVAFQVFMLNAQLKLSMLSQPKFRLSDYDQISQQSAEFNANETVELDRREAIYTQNGIRIGRIEAKQAEMAIAARQAIDSFKRRYPMSKEMTEALIPLFYDVKKDKIQYARIEKLFYSEGFIIGAREGAATALREAPTSKIEIPLGADVWFPIFKSMPMTLDCQRIAQLLCNRPPQSFPLPLADFTAASTQILEPMIVYLNRTLAATGTLSRDEQELALKFFHTFLMPEFAPVLYENYLDFYNKHQKPTQYPYWNANFYISTHAFFTSMAAAASSILDAAFSYAKGNTEFASRLQFGITYKTGKVSEVITENILASLKNIIYKNGLLYHYDQTRCETEQMLKRLLENLIVEVRDHDEEKKHSYSAGKLKGRMKTRLDVRVKLGLKTDDLRVEIDHNQRTIRVFLPKTPKFMETPHHDHHLQDLSVKYKLPMCPLLGILGKRPPDTDIAETLPDDGVLKEALNQQIPAEAIPQMAFATKDLGQVAKSVFVPVLRAALLPMVSLKYSFYQTELLFGNELITLN